MLDLSQVFVDNGQIYMLLDMLGILMHREYVELELPVTKKTEC